MKSYLYTLDLNLIDSGLHNIPKGFHRTSQQLFENKEVFELTLQIFNSSVVAARPFISIGRVANAVASLASVKNKIRNWYICDI